MTEFNATVHEIIGEVVEIRVYGTFDHYIVVNKELLDFDVSEGKELLIDIKEP